MTGYRNAAFAAGAGALICTWVGMCSCTNSLPGAKNPSLDTFVRAGLVMTANAVLTADDACADVSMAQAYKAAELTEPAKTAGLDAALLQAKRCAALTKACIGALTAGEDALNAGRSNDALCAIGKSVDCLNSVAQIIKDSGARVPPQIMSGLEFGRHVASMSSVPCGSAI